ncbi:MAG: hypothetical protein ACSLFM_14900 [Tepidiformaceae bacterium]
MADRIEREIEEILERLDDLPDSGRSPIPIASRKRKGTPAQAVRPTPATARRPRARRLDPPILMMIGAVVMIGGFILATAFEPLIWLSFAGVLLFIAAFAWALTTTGRPKPTQESRGVYWRDRYIEYDPPSPSVWDRVAGRFRRR